MTVKEPKKAAEAFGLSAILAIVFCGFTMVTYAEHNISAKSHTVVKQSMKLIAHISEMVIFILLGTSAVTDFWVHWNTAFVMWTLLFISVFRLISVYGLTAILNRNRVEKISFVDQFIMAYGGLRGGIAFGLMKLTSLQLVPHSNAMLCVTLVVVFFTSFIQGATAGPFVQLLHVRKKNNAQKGMNEEVYYRAMGHLNSGINDVVGRYGMSSILRRFARFNAKYINPIFTRDALKSKDQEILEINKRMNIREATKIVSGGRKSTMPTTAAKMNIAQMMLPNVAMMLPGLGHLISETDKKQEEAEENIILHAHLKKGLLETKDKLEAKAIIGETNDTSNADVLKKYKKELAAIRRRSETHRHRHERVTGNAVVTSGETHYLRPAEALSRRAFFSVPRERHISERHVSVMDTIQDKSGSDDCISITSEKSMKAHPWRYTQAHEAQVDPRGHE